MSQNINIKGGIKNSGTLNIRQTLNYGIDPKKVKSPKDFAAEVKRLADEVSKLAGTTNDANLKDAWAELKEATWEAQKPKADGSKVRRFLSSTKSLLEEAAGTIGGATALAAAADTLIKLVRPILGG